MCEKQSVGVLDGQVQKLNRNNRNKKIDSFQIVVRASKTAILRLTTIVNNKFVPSFTKGIISKTQVEIKL